MVHHLGASAGLFVRAAGFPLRAFLKPGTPFPDHTPWPAVEKICADIAIDVGVPVPPTQLYRRHDAPDGHERRTCVSLVMDDRFTDWKPGWVPETEDERAAVLSLLAPVSGIIALDTYLGNVDRSDSRPNAVFYGSTEAEPPAQVAFIDFANCLNRQDRWVRNGWTPVGVPKMPQLLRDAVQPKALLDVVERIEWLPDDVIDDIVGRIPDDYLDRERKVVVAEALLERRSLIRGALAKVFPIEGG